MPCPRVLPLALLSLAVGGCSTSSASEDGSGETGSSSTLSETTSSESESSSSATSASETTESETTETTTGDGDGDGDGDTGPDTPLPDEVRNYIFGHSLLLHTDTQNVPMWLAQFTEGTDNSYTMAGQYGFSDTHAENLPPFAQWGVTGVTGAWDSDAGESFADVDFTTVLFTAANFRQYYPPTQTDPDGILSTSVVENTVAVFDWVDNAEPTGVRYIIYENWPDMGGMTSADFSTTYPSASELADYWAFTSGDFHQWWLDYQDAMIAMRPDLDVRMVPVGPVLAQLLTGTLSEIPPEDLYEDDAPHGETTLYFLAALTTHMAVYGERPPADFVVPPEISSHVSDNYDAVVEEIWQALEDFDDDMGVSRVW